MWEPGLFTSPEICYFSYFRFCFLIISAICSLLRHLKSRRYNNKCLHNREAIKKALWHKPLQWPGSLKSKAANQLLYMFACCTRQQILFCSSNKTFSLTVSIGAADEEEYYETKYCLFPLKACLLNDTTFHAVWLVAHRVFTGNPN